MVTWEERRENDPLDALTAFAVERNTTTAKARSSKDQIKSPRGVSGKQRELFLGLTPEQQEVYRYHYDVCGRLAAHCYQIATGQWSPR